MVFEIELMFINKVDVVLFLGPSALNKVLYEYCFIGSLTVYFVFRHRARVERTVTVSSR